MNIAALSFKEFVSTVIIKGIIQPITILIFALSILYFLWNVTQFIRKSDDPKEIEKFKTNAMWGIVAIFVMASMWGLVQILINSFVPGAGIPSFDSGARLGPGPINATATFKTGDKYNWTNSSGHGGSLDSSQTSFWNGAKWVDKSGNATGNIGDGVSPRQLPIEGAPSPTPPK